jgi:hypothetical protein
MGFDAVELWGCGFNQFNQIDGSGKDVEKPQQITSVVASDIDFIEVPWAGWADLLCTSPNAHCLIWRYNPRTIGQKSGSVWIQQIFLR